MTTDLIDGCTVTLSQFRYVLDWFENIPRKINLNDYAYFYLESRGGDSDWYLCHYKYINEDEKSCKPCGNYWIHTYVDDFNLSDPADAVIKLGNKLKGYRCLHINTHFPDRLRELFKRVDYRKEKAA